jgi:hypothetical protein
MPGSVAELKADLPTLEGVPGANAPSAMPNLFQHPYVDGPLLQVVWAVVF